MKIVGTIVSLGLLFASSAFACGHRSRSCNIIYTPVAGVCFLTNGHYVLNGSTYPDANGNQLQCLNGTWFASSPGAGSGATTAGCLLADGQPAAENTTVPDAEGNLLECVNGQWTAVAGE